MRILATKLLRRNWRGLTSQRACSSSSKEKPAPPQTFELDGLSIIPDQKWNLSGAVLKTLQRRLLFEDGNPLNLIKQRIIDFFYSRFHMKGGFSPMFTVIDSLPRVVSVFDNFDSLLVPKNHVSRSVFDTYYINEEYCLRAHTSAHQHSLIKQGLDNFLVVGDVYRRDAIDRTHFPCFHQLEGVRLFTAAQLFNDHLNPQPKPILASDIRTAEKQAQHTEDAANFLIKDLKVTLEDLCQHIFGNVYDMRWINAEFPFTHPSFELEVHYDGKWMEVLGCGVMEQDLLQMAGIVDRVGWAFGLGLERLAMVLYGIPDIRLFWTRDSGFLTQFAEKSPYENFKYVPISVYPQVFYDLSFWLPEDVSPEEMTAETYDLIRSVGGGLIEQVTITDTFLHPKLKKISQTYRLVYRSHERTLTKEEVNQIHSKIREKIVKNGALVGDRMMIRPLRCSEVQKHLCCSSKRALATQKTRQRDFFDIDAVTADYEKRTERAASPLPINTTTRDIFRLILPPPNVTGNLHLGHALTVIIEDTMCRCRRLQGQKIFWYPGFDHAGIATQAVVERVLWNEKKLFRHEITQHDFLQLCQQWKQNRVADILKQLKILGATLNWNRVYYTLDDKFCEAVTTAFCQLYRNGLIFSDMRMVNWCPTLRSTISDQEVDVINVGKDRFISVKGANSDEKLIEVGVMHRIRYELLDSASNTTYLEVGTTRPETVFADCALAVNPRDERFGRFVGCRVRHPLLPERTLPVLADDSVQADKGTGILKVTPAHDFVDFTVARKHSKLLCVEDMNRSCIDEMGCLINAPGFTGMDRFEARKKIIQKLIECDKYGGVMPYHEQQLRICSRTGDIIEPMVRKQWFMDCSTMNETAIAALKNGSLGVTPKYMQVHLENWLSRKEPWCLSRQIDWGHRIPAFRRDSESEWIVARNKAEALRIIGESDKEIDMEQEKDVLDTWFCSALIPIVLSGWPQKRIESISLSVLETGYDIVGFWVARMVTVCHSLTGHLPFQNIVLHGLICDETGKKMSKSLGNVIDPMDIIEGISLEEMLKRLNRSHFSEAEKGTMAVSLKSRFPEGINRYGPDALRFALLRHDVTSVDIRIDILQNAEEGLRFCNKLWNLCTYVEEVCRSVEGKASNERSFGSEHPEDLWIRSRLENTLLTVVEKMESNYPHLALTALYKFLWNDLCDVYVETTKKALWSKDYARLEIVAYVLLKIIKKSLTHLSIFMPFVSEYLFDRINRDEGRNFYDSFSVIKPSLVDKKLEQEMSFALAVIKAIRSMRSQFGLSSKNTLQVACYSFNLDRFRSMVEELCNITLVTTRRNNERSCGLPFPVPGYSNEVYVALEGDHGPLIRKELIRRLQKAEKRREQFLYRAEKHAKLAENADKADLVERYKKKSRQAEAVVNGMAEEISKLRALIDRAMELHFNTRATEILLMVVGFAHVIVSPCTKVEESFNIQAIHDILFHRLNFSEYDHHQFPGVVPRTFIGALAVGIPLLPVAYLFDWQKIPKYWMLFIVRFVLGGSVLFAFCKFARQIEKKFGILSAEFLRVIAASQFHFMFYCSRPLPNTFALIGVLFTYQKLLKGQWLYAAQIATIFTILFRCELLLLYACIFIRPILTRTLPLFGRNGAIVRCLLTALKTLAITVPIDSFLWQRWLWPEGEVLWYNVVLNKSHEYGISPYLWYFYSALPRALVATIIFVPLGTVFDRRLVSLLAPILCYILLYSFLPHKELRFIIYTIPILNVSAAVFTARVWINRWKSVLRLAFAYIVVLHLVVNCTSTSLFTYASSKNYPGGEALGYLQVQQLSNREQTISVYIDNYAAQTGVNRFMQLYNAWEYNKTENMKPSQLSRFDFLMIGSYTEYNVSDIAVRNFSSTHQIIYVVSAFRKIRFIRVSRFPYYLPSIYLDERLVVMQKL